MELKKNGLIGQHRHARALAVSFAFLHFFFSLPLLKGPRGVRVERTREL